MRWGRVLWIYSELLWVHIFEKKEVGTHFVRMVLQDCVGLGFEMAKCEFHRKVG